MPTKEINLHVRRWWIAFAVVAVLAVGVLTGAIVTAIFSGESSRQTLCEELNKFKAPFHRQLADQLAVYEALAAHKPLPSVANPPPIIYFKEHPDELKKALPSIRQSERNLRRIDCAKV